MTDLIKYETDTGIVELNKNIIKDYLVSGDPNKVTDQELEMALRLCQYQGLNPFLKEVYIIKFGSTPAQIVVGKDVFTKRAKKNKSFKGFKAGIIISNVKGEVEYRSGTFYTKQEKLLGAFCNVYIENWDTPLEHTVALEEFNKGTATWKSMPGTMIRKVALVQALREAFPEDFQGLYDGSEMGADEPIINNSQPPIQENLKKDIDITDYISDAQRKRMFALANNEAIVRTVIAEHGYQSTNDIKKSDYESICNKIEEYRNEIDLKVPEQTEEAEFEVLDDDLPFK